MRRSGNRRENVSRREATGALLAAAFALASLLAPAAPPALAQSVDQTAIYIERTAEILQQVGEAVRESESDRARRVLEEATAQHETSLRLLDQDHPLLAMGASRRARESAQSAGRLARESLTFEARARLRLERSQDHLDGLLERAREQHNDQAQRFLDEARRQLDRAREQYAQTNFELALNLCEAADGLLNRAARLLFEQGGAQRLERELEQTAAMIEQARAAARERADRAASDLCERAVADLDRARELMQAGEAWRALRSAQKARRLALRAAAPTEPGVTADSVRELVVRWDERRAEIDARATREGDKRAQARTDRAAEHRRRAQELLDAGKLDEALRAIKIAHDLLSEAGEPAR